MSDTVWIKLDKLERNDWQQINGEWKSIPLAPINRMYAKAQRRRFYNSPRRYWTHNKSLPDGWNIERVTDEQMIAEGWRKVPRNFNGEVIIRPDCGYADSVQVQLPAEYGDTVVVRMYGKTLATAVCEGLVVGDRIRGPFRLLELGGTMTLTLRS